MNDDDDNNNNNDDDDDRTRTGTGTGTTLQADDDRTDRSRPIMGPDPIKNLESKSWTEQPQPQSQSQSPPQQFQNLLKTPTLAKNVWQERTTEQLSMTTEGDNDNDHQDVKYIMDEVVDDDPLMNKYVATPRTPTGRDTSSSLFFSTRTSPITTTAATAATAICSTSMSPLVSPTTIETHNTPVLRLNDRKDHATSPSTRHPVPFSPSMLLDRYEQHMRRRRVSLDEMRRNPPSLVAPCLAGKLVIKGQTKASAKESSSTTLDGDHVPLRKRVRLEESVQSKGSPFTDTKATLLDVTGGCHDRFVTNNVGHQSRSHNQYLRGDEIDQNHRDHHRRRHHCPLQSPPSLSVQHHSPVSEFLRRRHHANKPPSSSNQTVRIHQNGSASFSMSAFAVDSDVYPIVEVVLPSPTTEHSADKKKTKQRQGAVVVPPIPSFQTNSRFPLPRARNNKK